MNADTGRKHKEAIVKKSLIVLGLVALASIVPAAAGGVAVYGTGWDAKDADNVGGVGASFGWNLGETLDLVAQAAFYQEMSSEPFEDLVDADGDAFEEGVKVIPLEVLLHFNFARDSTAWHPYIGAGGAYYALDTTDFGNIDDEFGWLAEFGSSFGDGNGADLHAAVGYRFVKGEVTDLGDLDDDGIDEGDFDIDLSGPYANVGVVWHW